MRTKLTYVFVVGCVIFAANPSLMAGGWLSRATGGRLKTPEPIRKIAPNGISIRDRSTMSYIPDDPSNGWRNEIASDGSVIKRSPDGRSWRRTSRKASVKVINGQR